MGILKNFQFSIFPRRAGLDFQFKKGFTPHQSQRCKSIGMPDITTKKDEDKKPRVLLLGAGFTLIEMLIVMMVFGIVAAALVGIFLRSIKAGSKADAIAEVKENGDFALGVMERVLRNAESVGCGGSSISYVIASQTLIDQGWSPSGSFGLSDSQIVHNSQPLTASNLIASDLDFNCSGSPAKLVTISFTLTRSDPSDEREYAIVDFSGAARLREY